MNIDAEINTYLSRLSETEKKILLDIIKKLDSTENKSSFAERIVAYNNELEEAVQKIRSGDFLEHEDVLKESDEW